MGQNGGKWRRGGGGDRSPASRHGVGRDPISPIFPHFSHESPFFLPYFPPFSPIFPLGYDVPGDVTDLGTSRPCPVYHRHSRENLGLEQGRSQGLDSTCCFHVACGQVVSRRILHTYFA